MEGIWPSVRAHTLLLLPRPPSARQCRSCCCSTVLSFYETQSLIAEHKTSISAMPGATTSAGLVELHRSRFVEWQPAGVAALAASGDGSVVAAAREDGDIELYETATSYCFQVGGKVAEQPSCMRKQTCDCPPHLL